jgi:hypothetical protein
MPKELTTNVNLQDKTPIGIYNGLAQEGLAELAAGKSDHVAESPTNKSVTPPIKENRPDRLAAAKDWTDLLSKAIPLVAGTIYFAGYFVTARRLAVYGASVTHLLDAQYFMAGLPLGLLLCATVVTTYQAWQHDPKRDDSKLQNRVGLVAIGLFVVWGIIEFLSHDLNPSALLRAFLKQEWFDLYMMTLVSAAGGLTTLWYLIVSLLARQPAELRRYLRELGKHEDAARVYQVPLMLLVLAAGAMIGSFYRAMRVFDAIPQAYGGGKPVTVLGRALAADEAREVMNIARRITAILLLEPALDANYESVKRSCYEWRVQ